MDDKRRHERIPVTGVYGNLFWTFEVEILNLSIGGAAIKLDRKLKNGKECYIKFEDKGRHLELRCNVIWCMPDESAGSSTGNKLPVYYAGLRFNDVFTTKIDTLTGIIKSYVYSDRTARLRGVRVMVDSVRKAEFLDPFGFKLKLISPVGMLVETTKKMDTEERFPAELFLKEITPFRLHLEEMEEEGLPIEMFLEGGSPIRLFGRVVSCVKTRNSDAGTYDIGIEFLEMYAEDWAKLQAFIGLQIKK